MYNPINQLPDSCRVWFYQANRFLQPAEVTSVQHALQDFCQQWNAHGHDLQSSFDIEFNRMVILTVNEQAGSASGCSIDGSVRVFKGLNQEMGIDFLSRTDLAYLDGEHLRTVPVNRLKEKFSQGELTAASQIINVWAGSLGEWRLRKVVPAEKTWLAKYLPKSALAI